MLPVEQGWARAHGKRPKGKSEFTECYRALTSVVFKAGFNIGTEAEPEIIIEYIRVPIFDDTIKTNTEYDNHTGSSPGLIYDNCNQCTLACSAGPQVLVVIIN
jgi:hypothetical protein